MQRRRDIEHMRVRRFQQVRQRLLRAHERGAHVDLVHQVETLHRRREGAGEADRRGVVDQNVDAAESLHRLVDGGLHLRLVAYVGRDLTRRPAASFDICRRRSDAAGQLGLGSAVLPMTTMLAPSCAARIAIAWPMPGWRR